MILQALNRYYEILAEDPASPVAPLGYSRVGVSFAIDLGEDGKILNLIPLFVPSADGKRELPLRLTVPEQVKRSVNIAPNFLCDNATYILGISGKESKSSDFAVKRFESFAEYNIRLLEKADCAPARAVIAYLEGHDSSTATSLSPLIDHLEALLKGANLVFRYQSHYVHEDDLIRRVWEEARVGRDAIWGQCSVTGKKEPIARLHSNIKGVKDAQSSGAALVSFNAPAYESYNKGGAQGLNAPVSERVAFGYTQALNYLLSSENPNRKFILGDTTVIYWAESNDNRYANAFAGLFAPEDKNEASQSGQVEAEEHLKSAAKKVREIQPVDLNELTRGLESNPQFYVLGLAPNAARLSVRFFFSDPFNVFLRRIMQYYEDLEIEREFSDQPRYLPVWQVIRETVSKKSKDKEPAPLLAGAVIRAILGNFTLPAALFNAILLRIRSDSDTGYTRSAILKACLIRKYRNQPEHPIKEGLKMSLNEECKLPAYVLGRLFAVLEKAQQDAIGETNASIKDRYFTSACATPASVFPILLRLAQHHFSKTGHYLELKVQDLLNMLEGGLGAIPSHLTLDEQGLFVLGYYHQRANLYKPRKVEENSTPIA